jgi:ribosomal protein S18 acetylase RimI-like enzyme
MAALDVRLATPADLAALAPLVAALYALEAIPWDAERMPPALAELLRRDDLGFAALAFAPSGEADRRAPAERAPVGYAVVTYGYDVELAGRDAFLTDLYLVPAARGGGRGAVLLAEVEARARARGVGALHLMVRHENAVARALYARAGYVDPGRVTLTKRLAP